MSQIIDIREARYQRKVRDQAALFNTQANRYPRGSAHQRLWAAVARDDAEAAEAAMRELGVPVSA